MLTILNDLGKHRDEATGTFDLDALTTVYVAPMKAHVQEMVGKFSSRLKAFSVTLYQLECILY
jgi:pre-mRNA-splicing helicase BRR2